MDEKLEKLAAALIERADAYTEPFGKDRRGFMSSASYPVAMALREVAAEIRKINNV